MNKLRLYSSLLAILIIMSILALPLPAQKPPGGFKPDELICKMEPGFDIDIINAAYGTTTQNQQPQTNCYLLMITQGQDAESLAAVIDARPDVVYCRPNFYLTAPEPYQRSEPFLDVQYTGTVELQEAAITLNLSAVHAISEGEGVKIAVIDGGVNFLHPFFSSLPENIISRWDYIDNDSIAFDEPGGLCSGHGTFVAGIIKLVAPASSIYVYRVLDTAGLGDGYNIATAVLQAVEDSCRVINLSLGMVGIHDALDDAVRYAKNHDIMVVASAGNDSSSSNLTFPFPATRTYCMAVAAVDSINRKADFSNYGDKVDICAPGTAIYAPYLDTGYAWWDGTSFSTAFVTGLAGLIVSIDPTLEWDEIDSAILKSADNIDSLNPGLEGMLGWGSINIMASLSSVASQYADGDINGDGSLNIMDVSYFISFLYRDGPPPVAFGIADVNGSGILNIQDITYLINYLYRGGPPPQ
jgi:subtilisin family serine protease